MSLLLCICLTRVDDKVGAQPGPFPKKEQEQESCETQEILRIMGKQGGDAFEVVVWSSSLVELLGWLPRNEGVGKRIFTGMFFILCRL